MNRSDLTEQLLQIMQRSDYPAVALDGFFDRALRRIASDLRAPQSELTEVLTAGGSPGIYDLPADYQTVRAVYWDGSVTVELKALSDIEAAKWSNSQQNERPLGYRIVGPLLYTFPPTSAENVRMVYRAKPSPLVTGPDSNWVTENYDLLMSYSLFIEAAIWERDAESLTIFTSMYSDALISARDEAEKARSGPPVAASHYQAPTGIPRSM